MSASILDIVPQQRASKLVKLWVQVLKKLERDLGFNLQFSTAENIPTLEKQVFEGNYDLLYMNPHHYAVFLKSLDIKLLCERKISLFRGFKMSLQSEILKTWSRGN